MIKPAKSRRTRETATQKSKATLRIASKKIPVTTLARKALAVRPRKTGTQPTGKIATIAALLRHPKGASIEDLVKATGWQARSVRGAISASIRKKLGLKVTSEKAGAVRLYRIADKTIG